MADELTAIIAEMRRLCDKAQAIIEAGNRPLVELAEVEPDPEVHDNPDGGYWIMRCNDAGAKLCAMNVDAYEEVYQKWDYSWTWREIAELYERRLAELTEAQGGR